MQYIRADANSVIATGHIMRCMAVAEQLRKQGEQITFLVADEYPAEMLSEQGFEMIVLHTDWRDMESELEVLEQFIQKYQISSLLVDSYQVTEAYFKKLSKLTKVIYLDDRNEFSYDVAEIINYCHYYKQFGYEERYAGLPVRLWLGCDYIPLREEFRQMPEKQITDTVQNVMITTGGTDRFHVTESILQSLPFQYPNIQFHGVIGRFFENRDRLYDLEERQKNITLYEKISRMSDLMKQCDMAFSAGGTTLYELCACGIPTVCFSVADNQKPGVGAMAEQAMMLGAGDVRDNEEFFKERLIKKFDQMQDSAVRQAFSRKMQRLVDGNGADRIAKILCGKTVV